MKKLLITGASGDLGGPLSELAARHTDVVGTYHMNSHTGGGRAEQLDLRDPDAVRRLIEHFQPDVILHTAISDRAPSSSIPIAARNLVDAVHGLDIRLIALSTDMVFDGTAPPYSEYALPTPLSDYGRAKVQSEAIYRESGANFVIIRTSLIYDFTENNRQISWMLERIREGKRVPLFVDEFRSPVHVWNLGAALLELSASNFTGTLNIAGPEALSRHEYGVHLLTALGCDVHAHVEQVKASEIAPHRPRNLSLDISLAQSVLTTRLLSVGDAAAAFTQPPKAT
jgi:dTDP-4-dehydrorhamnose reductase